MEESVTIIDLDLSGCKTQKQLTQRVSAAFHIRPARPDVAALQQALCPKETLYVRVKGSKAVAHALRRPIAALLSLFDASRDTACRIYYELS